MTKFRKKPVVIEAYKWDGEWYTIPTWISEYRYRDKRCSIIAASASINIPTLEGDMLASLGDWIIKGVKGELYPCKPDIFEQTYERVDE